MVISLVLAACQQAAGSQTAHSDPVEEQPYCITSPVSGWAYYRNRAIHLSMNTRSQDIDWFIENEDFIGRGNNLSVLLREGVKKITAVYKNRQYSVDIEVFNDIPAPLEERRYNIAPPELNLEISPGNYYPSVVSFDGTAALLSVLVDDTSLSPRLPEDSPSSAGGPGLTRDFRMEIPDSVLQELKNGSLFRTRSPSFRLAEDYEVGNIRQIKVLDTTNQYNEPHIVDVKLYHIGEKYTLWLRNGVSYNSSAFSQIKTKLDSVIMPRLNALWGDFADIDGDGKIAIVFSDTINSENVALGYFNPLDMLLSGEASDNSFINKMDVVYIAFPSNDPLSSFNVNAILATIAHEITHAITYSQKTYNKILQGVEVNREELFLDEGLSHLSETLCGFGVSGGNILFLNRYFENPQDYSFCTPNRAGQNDSTGMRGAMSLLLSWIFWNKGGMSVDRGDPGLLSDNGGITFLKNLLQNNLTGWNGLSDVLDETIEYVFGGFAYALNRHRALGDTYAYVVDPHTGEPLEFSNNMGIISYHGTPYNISMKTPVSAGETITTLPWSFFLLPPVQFSSESVIKVKTGFTLGKSIFSFIKYP